MDTACLVCHEPIEKQIITRSGIHGSLQKPLDRACAVCHHEHLGGNVALVSDAAFREVGVVDREIYDHSHVGGLSLQGAHDRLECTKCHANAKTEFLREGQKRFLGLDQTCTTCHDDVHKGELGPNCAECHGQLEPFKKAPLFAHPETFPLNDGHSGLLCSQCHFEPKVYTGLTTICADCHMGDFDKTTNPPHALAGLSTTCVDCHNTVTWDTTTYTHAATFPLVGAHDALRCAECHTEGPKQDRTVAFNTSHSCVACHESPHPASMLDAVAALTPGLDTCQVCHEAGDRSWSRSISRLSPELHNTTGFSLAKPHDTQACVECHVGIDETRAEKPPRPTWSVTFQKRAQNDCEACHKDPHDSQFAAAPYENRCVTCHAMDAFFPCHFDLSMHEKTRFPLDGSHRAVACAACHKVENDIRRFKEVTMVCADCHEDVHKGKFDAEGLPVTIAGKTGCARCHTTMDFHDITWTVDQHKIWTGEALTGKHAQAACNDCHRRDPAPRGSLAAFKPASKACSDCHDDIHAGQFAVERVTDCAKCHQSTDTFKTLVFDHQRDSRFALDADHAKLDCIACHKPVEFSGRSIVRYKPLGVECADCHGTQFDPNSPRRRREPNRPIGGNP
ncbi:MAG: hypothetical protein AB7Q00_01975 [Phycisphaerales bacterium]|nr:MAG: hypothetical protein IPK69_06595 [Phycisphaerales bacterium]